MMTISEIKRWAKEYGYTIIKEKEEDTTQYYWSKDNDPMATGISPSVSKVARDIYNHITDNKWVEHQQNFVRTIKDYE